MAPACLLPSPVAPRDPGLLSARWSIDGTEPYALLEELLGGADRDSRKMAFAGGGVTVTTRRQDGGSLLFAVRTASSSLCRARLGLTEEGDTLVEVTYRRSYGSRLLTTPEGTLLLEILMGCLLPPAAGIRD